MDKNKMKEIAQSVEKEFFGQECQDAEINRKYRDLHLKIVNEVISFCKENNITVDELYLRADCLSESIKFGSWHPATDSCFELLKETDTD